MKLLFHWLGKAKSAIAPLIAIFLIAFVLFTIAIPKFGGHRPLRLLAYRDSHAMDAGQLVAGKPAMDVEGGMGGNEIVGGDGNASVSNANMPASAPMLQKEASADEEMKTTDSVSAVPGENTAQAQVLAETLKPQIIKTAQLTLEVENIVTSVTQIENITQAHGGLVTNKNVTVTGENNQYRSGSLVVRVPQPQLDAYLGALHALGIAHSENISSEDVGKQVVDLEARVRNLQAQEKVLLTIMNRAGKIPDVLQAAEQLSEVRGQIEENQGELNYLRQQVAYSTVTITLSEKTLVSPTQGKPGFFTVIGNSAKQSFSNLLDFINALLACIVGFLIYWVPVAAILWVLSAALWKLLFKRLYARFRENGKDKI